MSYRPIPHEQYARIERMTARRRQLVAMLERGRRTSAEMAAALGCSRRTLHRDVEALVASGERIIGQAGMGYMIWGPQP